MEAAAGICSPGQLGRELGRLRQLEQLGEEEEGVGVRRGLSMESIVMGVINEETCRSELANTVTSRWILINVTSISLRFNNVISTDCIINLIL